jgi:MoxR-like ATPase
MSNQRFSGTEQYVATDDLMMAVNAAITLARPLFEWHIKSTSNAQHGLYEYDAVSRLRDSQLGDARVHNIRNYITPRRCASRASSWVNGCFR